MTRDAWRDTAVRAAVPVVEVEVVCSDPAEHRQRVASRSVDIPGLPLPDWREITEREYEPWDRPRLVVDTAGRTPEESVGSILGVIAGGLAPDPWGSA